MSKIGDIGSFFQRLRKTTPKNATGDVGGSGAKTTPKAPSTRELKSTLRARIRGIDTSSPAGLRKARRVFIETSLAWEFGDAIVLDPEFETLVEKIEADFNYNDKLKTGFAAAIEDLRKS